MTEIIKLPTAASKSPAFDPTNFYKGLKIPPGCMAFMIANPNREFRVFRDPKNGDFAGLVFNDVYKADKE